MSLNKEKTFKGAITLFVVALVATLVFTGCPQSNNGGKENTQSTKKYKVSLNKTAGGDVTTSPKLSADGMVEENTEIIFTAKEDEGYEVDSWTISAGTFAEGGTKGSKTAKIKVSQDVAISVIFKKNAGVEEGVWKILSMEMVENGNKTEEQIFPVKSQDGKNMVQPYYCLSGGKVYAADKSTKIDDPTISEISQDNEMWDKPYTYVNNVLNIDPMPLPFVVTGNTAISKQVDGNNSATITFERVSSPTVEEIKAAKKI